MQKSFQSRQIRNLRRPVLRSFLVFAFGVFAVILFWPKTVEIDLAASFSSLLLFSKFSWVVAAGLIAVSVAAVASYDLYALRAMGIRVPNRRAVLSGFLATAISQFVGFGIVSGTLLRWRVIGGVEVTLCRALAVTLFVSIGFFSSAAIWCLVFWSVATLGLTGLVFALFLMLAVVLMFAWTGRDFTLFSRRFSMPGLATVGAFLALSLVDLVAAGTAFWMFLPAHSVDLLSFLAGFPIALMAGLISAIPGAAGAMDLMMLSLFPKIDPASIFAALLAFRLLGIALPAVLAFVVLVILEFGPDQGEKSKALGNAESLGDKTAKQASGRIPHSGTLRIAQSGHCLMGFGSSKDQIEAVSTVFANACKQGLIPVHYSAGAEIRAWARAQGFSCVPCGSEAIIDLATFSLSGRARAGLRRKLKCAAKAGLIFKSCGAGDLPTKEMDEIARLWRQSRGNDRGFVMSRYKTGTVPGQRCFVATKDGRVVGFVSFVIEAGTWTLDLIRHDTTSADGAIYGLITAAIEAAQREGASKFSLASVPFYAPKTALDPPQAVAAWVFENLNRFHRAKGLQQFKQTFRPEWQQRYLVARNPVSAAIAALEVVRNCLHPLN